MTTLRTRNKEVLQKTLRFISRHKIIRFHTQSALYVLIENIKFPFLKNSGARSRNPKAPAYMPVNYTPIINRLVEEGVLTRVSNTKSVEYFVDKNKLNKALAIH